MWGIIGTWEMVFEGVRLAAAHLKNQGGILDALEVCVCLVEDEPKFTSVGYGGLPNEQGQVELDAAFMDGNTLSIGAVAGIKDYKNPCKIARKLMNEPLNNFLVGMGAEHYAHLHGFTRQNMLTPYSKAKWLRHKERIACGEMRPYIGHDTVCAIGVDVFNQMANCTSTSGLFYKKQGRVGDSPLPGAGYYVSSEDGGACATGLGEDLMKGAISYEIVRLMREGMHPMAACNQAVDSLHHQLVSKRGKAGDLSVIAMNPKGEFGASTNIERFPFAVATENQEPALYMASYIEGVHKVEKL